MTVKLAERFMFVDNNGDEGGIIYTAEETDTGDYRVSWLDDGHSNFKTLPYDRDTVYSNIVSGAWIVRQVFPKAEQPTLKYVSRVVHSAAGNAYTLKAHESGIRYVLVSAAGAEYDFGYTEELVENNIKAHGWKLEPVAEASLEPSDNVIEVWPFPVSTVVDTLLPNGQPEPEFLPPDDIEPLPDYGISLSSVRESVRSLQSAGWVVEVCADFYTVRQDGDVYSNKFVASSEEDLAAIFQAIRTLDKFADRG